MELPKEQVHYWLFDQHPERYMNTHGRFHLGHLGQESFDGYAVALVDGDQQQRLLWCDKADNTVRDAFLPAGEIQRVARAFCDAMFNDPATAPFCVPKPQPAKKKKPAPVPTKAQTARLKNRDKLAGRKTHFHMLTSDEYEFVNSFAPEQVCYVAGESLPALPERIHLTTEGIASSETKIDLFREADFHEVVYRNSPSENPVVDVDKSLVVEFVRCRLVDNVLSRGRLYFTTGYYDQNGRWQDKPDDFIEWGSKLIQWIRTHYSLYPETGFYISAQVLRWSIEQDVTLKTI